MGKENKKITAQRRKKMSRKENFAVSDKGSWSGQTPSASSASAEDPERSKTLFARVLPLPLPLTL